VFAFTDKKSLGFNPTIDHVQLGETLTMQFITSSGEKNTGKFPTKNIISSCRGTCVFQTFEIDRDGTVTRIVQPIRI